MDVRGYISLVLYIIYYPAGYNTSCGRNPYKKQLEYRGLLSKG